MGVVVTPVPGILCLGEALVDRLGPPGGNPAVDRPVDDRLGGAPANVACGLARLGTEVAFLGRLGRDGIGDRFAGLFRQRGVDAAAVQWDADRPSRIVLVRRGADGERQFQGFAGDRGLGFADQALEPVSLSAGARWLLIGSLSLASAPSAESLRGAVAQARSQGTALALDVNWRPTFWDGRADPAEGPSHNARALIGPLLEQAALIKLAREEALWFFASEDPAVIHAALPQRPDVVVTDGAEPVRWCSGGPNGRSASIPTSSGGRHHGCGRCLYRRFIAPVAGAPCRAGPFRGSLWCLGLRWGRRYRPSADGDSGGAISGGAELSPPPLSLVGQFQLPGL